MARWSKSRQTEKLETLQLSCNTDKDVDAAAIEIFYHIALALSRIADDFHYLTIEGGNEDGGEVRAPSRN